MHIYATQKLEITNFREKTLNQSYLLMFNVHMYIERKYLIYFEIIISLFLSKINIEGLVRLLSYPTKLVLALEKKPSPSDYKSGWKYLS